MGDAVVSVNAVDPEQAFLENRIILGIGPGDLEWVANQIGEQILGISFVEIEEEILAKLFSGRLQKLEEGLYGNLFHRVPRSTCLAIEQRLGVKDVWTVGFRRGKKLFGNASLFTLGQTRLNREVVETFVNLASVALERRHAENELRKSEERFRGIYSHSPIGIELYDSHGRMIDANPACLDIFGVHRAYALMGFDLFRDPNVPE